MSQQNDPQGHENAHAENHEGPIKTPKQLVVAVAASFIIPILLIVLLVVYVDRGVKPAAGSDGLAAEAVAKRLQPIGTVEVRDASAPKVLRTGEQVYAGQCAACHTAGVAGAPKLGDVAAWAPRLPTGYDALLNSVLKGKGAMAAQGGGEYSDFELARAVVYMANSAGGKLAEPQPPAAAASAASAPN
ncbi:cytochrome C [beta proteobacterium AAP51]|jgi:cytochrome c5|nr:cytochrome C [beta proteobacterium AAP51]